MIRSTITVTAVDESKERRNTDISSDSIESSLFRPSESSQLEEKNNSEEESFKEKEETYFPRSVRLKHEKLPSPKRSVSPKVTDAKDIDTAFNDYSSPVTKSPSKPTESFKLFKRLSLKKKNQI